MSGYDLLASHYDAATGDSLTEAAFVSDIVRQVNSRAVTLLEVACGTGTIIEQLADRYLVSGLDISAPMLAVARAKLRAGTALHQADMSSFQLGEKYDAIVCVYHGINHLLTFASWKSFFACASAHLNDDGVLIFDVLTVDTLMAMADAPAIVQEFDGNYLLLTVSTAGDALFDWQIEVRVRQPDGNYESLTEVIRTASYPPDDICRALAEEFSRVELIESDGSVSEDAGNRLWFVCSQQAPLTHEG